MEKFFNKGDFVKYVTFNKDKEKVTFGIFEGVDLAPQWQYAKKYSLVAYYDSYQYCSNPNIGGAWEYRPVLTVASKNKECEKTIDTLVEDTWWKPCSEEEKKQALEILESYGYHWDEELLALVDMETGEIVHKIVAPKLEYHGDTIKPICSNLREKLKKSVLGQVKTSVNNTHYSYGRYDEFYD